jgi:Flp pilus assembly protein TadB
MNVEKSEASVGELFGSLASDTSQLVRQELQLATTEMTATAKKAARNTGLIAAGAAFIHLACIAAVVGLLAGLPAVTVVPLWAWAAIVAFVLAGLGLALVQIGIRAFRRLDPVPRDTLRTLRADGV